MGFGSKLQKLRKEKKFSQDEFGLLIGLSAKHISRIENEKQIPNSSTIKKIAGIFSVSIDYLLFDEVPKNKDLTKFSDAELVDLIFQIENLSEKNKNTAKNVLKALITQSKAEQLFK